MPFNFDKQTNRFNTHSAKWNVSGHELPMWVADMDFETSPAIVSAMQKRLDHHIFGYTIVPDTYYEAVANWWKDRHHFSVKKDWIMFCTGVVPAISSIVRKMTSEKDNVLVMAPVYNIFYNSIVNNHRNVLTSDLNYADNEYVIDFDDLEKKLSDPATSLLIFCNPHNPIGKIWERETLEKVGQLCIKHDVLILSDEIHCDLSHKGYQYTPFASISEEIADHSITCVSPTKAFNIAGIQTSSIIVPNEKLRKLVNRGINTDEVAEPNVFAIEAAIAAFSHGEPWLEALLDYLNDNKQLVEEFIKDHIPEVHVIHSEATYLAWIDCGKLTNDAQGFASFIRKETGLYISEGGIFGGNGDQFIRMNYACPRERLKDGLHRLKEGIQNFKKQEKRTSTL